jgi:hypothetical protein
MDLVASYHACAERIAILMGSDTVAHLNAGLFIYMATQLILRTRRASAVALHFVFAAAVANELLDRLYFGSWRWEDTAKDLVATLFWPTALYVMGRYRRRRWSMDRLRIARELAEIAPAMGTAPVPARASGVRRQARRMEPVR